MSSRERVLQAKQEGEANDVKFSRAPSSSRQWPGFRNPRIVRVSRSFGGKDRHSKVCTIRGLRDRRIRLSVPTAIQLYDLQDRLGLSQPSKVIDWLLDATKHDIDKLPPLQIPQGFGNQFHQQMLVSHESSNIATQSSFAPFFDSNLTFKEGIKINNNVDGEDQTIVEKSKYWDIDAVSRVKSKDVEKESIAEKAKWIRSSGQQDSQDGIIGYNGAQVSAQNFFPMGNHSSLPGSQHNNAMPYNPYYHWEPSNLSLSQFGSQGFLSQMENPLNNAAVSSSLTSNSLALPSGSQLFFCPSPMTPSLFPPYAPYINTLVESDPRQINHIQLLSSSAQQMLPSLPVNLRFHTQNDNESQPEDKDESPR